VRAFCASRPGGTDAIDAHTLWGEIDWAARNEDARGLLDFLFRRSDVGLGAEGEVRKLIPSLAARMALQLGWTPEKTALQTAHATEELNSRHAWRNE
jgi:glycerol-3-phosphate dehydrogenase